MSEVKEKCAIAAISISNLKEHPIGGASYYLYRMLLAQQNRGQLAAGITTFNPERGDLLKRYVDLGRVDKVFRTHHRKKHLSILKRFEGIKGIGHLRYATFGADDKSLAQPFEKKHGRKSKWFAFAFNGNITNYEKLRKELESKGYHFVHKSDTEAIMHLITLARKGEKNKNLVKMFKEITKKLDGAYSLVYLNAEGELIAIRDPYGFRPLVYGRKDGLTAIASESTALVNLGITEIRNLEPGKMLLIKNNKMSEFWINKRQRKAHCMFEWVYFANAASKLDHVSVYKTRWRLGIELAKHETLKLDEDFIVVPVPDTAKPAADAYALTLGLPAKEGLLRNRYVGRTFIESNERHEKVRNKYTLNVPVLKNKKILLVDDSIVRGITSKALISYIKTAGVKEIHLRVTAPPIFYPCFYGIDMSTLDELIAAKHKGKKEIMKTGNKKYPKKVIEKIRKEIGVKTLQYNSIKSLVKALKRKEQDLCLACLTGKYPTVYGRKLFQKSVTNFIKGKKQRTYEC